MTDIQKIRTLSQAQACLENAHALLTHVYIPVAVLPEAAKALKDVEKAVVRLYLEVDSKVADILSVNDTITLSAEDASQ